MGNRMKAKPPKLTIKTREGTKGVSTGANLILELDGKQVPYARAFKLESEARGLTKLTLEMYVGEVSVSIDAIGSLEPVLLEPELSKAFQFEVKEK